MKIDEMNLNALVFGKEKPLKLYVYSIFDLIQSFNTINYYIRLYAKNIFFLTLHKLSICIKKIIENRISLPGPRDLRNNAPTSKKKKYVVFHLLK